MTTRNLNRATLYAAAAVTVPLIAFAPNWAGCLLVVWSATLLTLAFGGRGRGR